MEPKFKKGDKVRFFGPKNVVVMGTVAICDPRTASEREFYGDWFTYDIWAPLNDGQECLFKHVPECNVMPVDE